MSRHGMMTALGSLPPRLNPATACSTDGHEGEGARLWKRVRTLETNLGYSNLALDDLPFRPDLGARHPLWPTDDYGSHHGHGQHRKRRVPGSGLPAKLCPKKGPAHQKRVFEEGNKKCFPSLSALPFGETSPPFTQPQQPFGQQTMALHRNRPLHSLPVPSKEGDERKNTQAGPAGNMAVAAAAAAAVVVARESLASYCGDVGILPPCPDASQRSPSGATANGAQPEVGQSSPRSMHHSMLASFVPPGVSNASPSIVRSASNAMNNATTAWVEAVTSANADDHQDGNFNFNKAGVSTQCTEFSTAAATDSSKNCSYSYDNSSDGQQDVHHDVERRETVSNEVALMGVDEKARGSIKSRKLRVRVPAVVLPGQKLRTIRAGYCRSLVSPNNPLTSNTVVARVKQGLQSGCEKRPKVLLVGSGTFNPVHKLHIRRFYLARNFLEARKGMRVVGGIVSPSHPTLVRQRHRVRAAEIIPPKHRLSMARAAVGEGSWLAVDPWEVTRKRIMDYMSVLEHAREVCQETFPSHAGDISILYMCQTSQIHHLNPTMLRMGGFGVITVCRPLEKERLLKELSPSFRNIAILVEDAAILSAELERTSSTMVRHLLKQGKSVEGMVGKAVARYIRDNDIAQRVSGKHKWTVEDNAFMFDQEDKGDRPYHNLPRIYMRRESQMPLHY